MGISIISSNRCPACSSCSALLHTVLIEERRRILFIQCPHPLFYIHIFLYKKEMGRKREEERERARKSKKEQERARKRMGKRGRKPAKRGRERKSKKEQERARKSKKENGKERKKAS